MADFREKTPADIQDINLSERLSWLFHDAKILNTVSAERDAIIREEAEMRHFLPEDIEDLVQRINAGTLLSNATTAEVKTRTISKVMDQIDLMP